ncbi:hypothetical protein [Pseudomonas sp. DP-17]|uniref:hypothetical protein n=1 Tax=Pseudomonas sp. DP-17 TaxID=1580486 RepID=UPI001EFA9034|nr:hypothetical protein [Pseudomonas sp. DP-17]MCG8910476.1 hypothetical protein [Pseudomonas sp. DP-17]
MVAGEVALILADIESVAGVIILATRAQYVLTRLRRIAIVIPQMLGPCTNLVRIGGSRCAGFIFDRVQDAQAVGQFVNCCGSKIKFSRSGLLQWCVGCGVEVQFSQDELAMRAKAELSRIHPKKSSL